MLRNVIIDRLLLPTKTLCPFVQDSNRVAPDVLYNQYANVLCSQWQLFLMPIKDWKITAWLGVYQERDVSNDYDSQNNIAC